MQRPKLGMKVCINQGKNKIPQKHTPFRLCRQESQVSVAGWRSREHCELCVTHGKGSWCVEKRL